MNILYVYVIISAERGGFVKTINATDVRKDWGGFIDSIVREKPQVIKRSRDYIVAISLNMLKEILSLEKLTITIFTEDDQSVTAVIGELDLMTNAPTQEEVIRKLAQDAIEYAEDFYNDFEYWHSAPNRKAHLPYIMAILSRDPDEIIKELFVCQVGKT
jgi:antitoxin YefM